MYGIYAYSDPPNHPTHVRFFFASSGKPQPHQPPHLGSLRCAMRLPKLSRGLTLDPKLVSGGAPEHTDLPPEGFQQCLPRRRHLWRQNRLDGVGYESANKEPGKNSSPDFPRMRITRRRTSSLKGGHPKQLVAAVPCICEGTGKDTANRINSAYKSCRQYLTNSCSDQIQEKAI